MRIDKIATPALLAVVLVLGPHVDALGGERRTGVFNDQLKDPSDNRVIIRYKMRVPEILPDARTLGLVVFFHGRTGNENSLFRSTLDPLRRLGLKDSYVIMGGKSRGVGWAKVDDEPVMEFIQWALKTYLIDPRRVHLIGYSSGAFMVTRFGWINQQHFATVTGYAGAASTRWSKGPSIRRGGSPAQTSTEFYLVHGDKDDVVNVNMSRKLCKEFKALGYRYIYRELDGHDHGSLGRVRNVKDDVFRWIHATRNKSLPLSREDRKTLTTLKFKIRRMSGEPAKALVAEAARIGGPLTGTVMASAFKATDPDVRLAAINSASTTSYGAAAILELGRLLFRDKDPAVRPAAIKALGAAARWRHLDAQAIPAKVLTHHRTSLDDRLAIVAQLGAAFDLMVLGILEDKLIPEMLVTLLDDKEQSVRAAAFAHLKKAVADGFSYSPEADARQRKAAVAKWKRWMEGATNKPLEGGYRYQV